VGQAKQRGTFEERKAEAIAEGRFKFNAVKWTPAQNKLWHEIRFINGLQRAPIKRK
jgi:hypothetical protein